MRRISKSQFANQGDNRLSVTLILSKRLRVNCKLSEQKSQKSKAQGKLSKIQKQKASQLKGLQINRQKKSLNHWKLKKA